MKKKTAVRAKPKTRTVWIATHPSDFEGMLDNGYSAIVRGKPDFQYRRRCTITIHKERVARS